MKAIKISASKKLVISNKNPASKNMGGKNSHGSIVVQLENSSSKGNEEITGVVHISLKNLFQPSTLHLIFKGKEQTHWTDLHMVKIKSISQYNRIFIFDIQNKR